MARKKSNIYWTKETEDAVIEYNETGDDRLFEEKIYGPLNKMAENIINRFKFPYMDGSFEDIKAEVVSYLVINLHKFSADKGKAFSYFSVIAKNYLILHNNKAYKNEKRSVYFSDQNPDYFDLEETLLIDPEKNYQQSEVREFTHMFIQYWEHNISKIFRKERDMKIAYAVLELLKRADHIENFNKKALYVMLREITDEETSHITKVVKRMKSQVVKQIEDFNSKGTFSDPGMYFIPTNDYGDVIGLPQMVD